MGVPTGVLTAVLDGEGDRVAEAAVGMPGASEEVGVGLDLGGGTGVDV